MPDYQLLGKAGLRVLARSAVAVSHTGNTNETALATITIPGGTIGLNGQLRIEAHFSYPNNANNKTMRARLGGIAAGPHMTVTTTTSVQGHLKGRISNRNAQNSQVSSMVGGADGTTATAVTTTAIDTSVSQDLVITGLLGNAADTITLESYEVELIP